MSKRKVFRNIFPSLQLLEEKMLQEENMYKEKTVKENITLVIFVYKI